MRRQIIVFFLSLFVWAFASAADRGALFKVTGGGHTMYLFGTMHVGRPDFYPLEPRISGALAHASTLALEVDPTDDPGAVAMAVQEHAFLAPNSAGYAGLPPAKKARLDRVLKQYSMEPDAVSRFKPWMVATLLALVDFVKLGYQPQLGVDEQLAQQAHAANKKVLSLESAEAQIALFDRLSDAQQWQLLDETLDEIESGREQKESRELIEAYASADQPGLDAVAARIETDPSEGARFMREVLIDGRNPALADKMAQLLAREENTVSAVGVLHLLGKRGIPALLRARGLKVERVY
jgi:uncharacterized protein YbaP (TraB family)